jgi:hypothetical protein
LDHALVVSLTAFMEVLDTSIAVVALPHIAGGLAASNDKSTWVLTSYLVSNAIVLPISGWLVGWLGRKRRDHEQMLKIDVARAPTEEPWILRGRLVEPWVEKLRASWSGHTKARGQRCVVNLNGVTFIDKNGERLLRVMSRARFIATDVCVRQVLDRLKCKLYF